MSDPQVPASPPDAVQADRPWRRPGRLRYAARVFRRCEQLRLVVAGRWLWLRNPLTGQFPAAYSTRRPGTCTVHWGADRPAHLLVPVTPTAT